MTGQMVPNARPIPIPEVDIDDILSNMGFAADVIADRSIAWAGDVDTGNAAHSDWLNNSVVAIDVCDRKTKLKGLKVAKWL